LSATFYAMYDDSYFYVAAKVADNVQAAAPEGAQPFDGDSLQVAFGTTAVGRPKPTMAATPPVVAPVTEPATTPTGGAAPADSAPPSPGNGAQPSPSTRSPSGSQFGIVANASAEPPATGGDASAGIPARGILEDTEYEFSLALTPQGPVAFKLRSPMSGDASFYPTNPEVGLGPTTDVKLAVKRDDINEMTVYEAAIPWSELADLPHDAPFHLAFKLNDKDRGAGVEGWIESNAGAGIARGNELSFSPSWGYTAANLCPWALMKP
jgi:hypothetical protein